MSLAPCWVYGDARGPLLTLSFTNHTLFSLPWPSWEPPTYSGWHLSSSFAGFLHHLLFSGQVSLLIFPCQQPLRASKSRLNNQSVFCCWRRPGQAGLGAKWLSPVKISGGSWSALATLLLSDQRQVLNHLVNLLKSCLYSPPQCQVCPFFPMWLGFELFVIWLWPPFASGPLTPSMPVSLPATWTHVWLQYTWSSCLHSLLASPVLDSDPPPPPFPPNNRPNDSIF